MTSRRLAWVVALGMAGCGGAGTGILLDDSFREETRLSRNEAFAVAWTRDLVDPLIDRHEPTEQAVAGLDPSRNRVYVGSSAGSLWSLDASSGRPVWRFRATRGIASEVVVGGGRDAHVYFGAEDGFVYSVAADDGHLEWRAQLRAPVRRKPILTADAVFVVTAGDSVFALERRSGARLWSYHRDAPEGFTIETHAGLALVEGHVLTGFADGVVVSLDAIDGSLTWERDASLDVEVPEEGGEEATPRFVDVDTTPVVVGESVYVASFAAGLYRLNVRNGNIEQRWGDLTGITGTAVASHDRLVLSSVDRGLGILDAESGEVRWVHRAFDRGAPSEPVVVGPTVFVGESRGSFIAFSLDDGRELGRLESGWGFSANLAVAADRGFVVSNGGSLYALHVAR